MLHPAVRPSRRRSAGWRAPLLVTICLFCTMTVSTRADDPISRGTREITFVSTWDGSEQPYHLYLPTAHDPDGEAVPLVIVLHGWGANWKSWFAATSVREWAEEEGYVVASPHGRGNWFYLGPGERDVLDTLDDVARRCNIDRDRVYLMGHSMGGWGTWHTAAAHPDLFAAIVPMSAWAPLELLPNLMHTPVLIIHGDADDVVPIEESRAAHAEFGNTRNEKWDFIEVEGAGHESSMISDMLPQIGDFFREKRSGLTASTTGLKRRIHHTTFTPSRGRHAWLQVHSVLDPSVESKIAGEIVEHRSSKTGKVRDSHLELSVDRNILSFVLLPHEMPELELAPTKITIPDRWKLSQPLNRHGHKIDAHAISGAWVRAYPELSPGQCISFTRTGASSDEIAGEPWIAWDMNVHPCATIKSPRSPAIASPDKAIAEPAPLVTELIRKATRADVALIPAHHVAPELPAGPWDAQLVLDIYLRYGDDLMEASVGAEAYADLVERAKEFSAWWHLELPAELPNDPAIVVFPKYLESYVALPVEPVGRTAREIIFRAVEAGEFP